MTLAVGSLMCLSNFVNFLQVTKQSRKFCPEAIIFIQTLLMAAMNEESEFFQDSQVCYLPRLSFHVMTLVGDVLVFIVAL